MKATYNKPHLNAAKHYDDVIWTTRCRISAGHWTRCSKVYPVEHKQYHQSSALLTLCAGNPPVSGRLDCLHKGPIMLKTEVVLMAQQCEVRVPSWGCVVHLQISNNVYSCMVFIEYMPFMQQNLVVQNIYLKQRLCHKINYISLFIIDINFTHDLNSL